MAETTHKMPDTQKAQVAALWNTVVGTNGEGMVEVVRKNREDIADMKGDVQFIKGKLEGHVTNPPSRRKILLVRIGEVAAMTVIIGGIAALLIAFLFGRLDADDVANILRAWKGVP